MPPKRSTRVKKPAKPAIDDYDSDDVPLSEMVAKKPAAAAAKKSSKKAAAKKPAAKNSQPSSKTKKPTTTATKMTQKTKTRSSVFYEQCEKGELVQEIMKRWWYGLTWPSPASLTNNLPDYEPVDTFPGVYIATTGPNIGHILDKRDKSTCPNFKNLAKKGVGELVTILKKCCAEQVAQMGDDEVEFGELKKAVEKTAKWADKLNAPKVEKEAEKIIKSNNLEF